MKHTAQGTKHKAQGTLLAAALALALALPCAALPLGLRLAARAAANASAKPYDSKVEYLESSGTQFVDTGLILSSDGFAYDADFLFVSGGGVNQIVFGGRTYGFYEKDDGMALFWTGALPYKGFRFDYFGNSMTGEVVKVGVRYSVSYSQGTTTVNGVDIPTPVVAGRKGKTSAYIFAGHRPLATGGVDYPARIRLYSFRLFLDDKKVADYIPVRKSGIGYLYDSVSDKLLGNGGTGSFVIGPDK